MFVSGRDTADIIRDHTDARANNFLTVASLVVLYYDYLLTLPTEVERYWEERQYTWTVTLFFLVRYMAIIGHVPVLVQVAWHVNDHSVCESLLMYHSVYIVISQAWVGLLLNIRTYALYDRDPRIKWLLSFISVIGLGVAFWAIFSKDGSLTPWEPPSDGCNAAMSDTQATHLAIAWTGLLVFDITIFLLTLGRVLALRKAGNRSLYDIIVRDGTMYFGFLALATLSTILTLVLGSPLIKGIPCTLTNVLSTSLIARLMFNIRRPDLVHGHQDLSTTQALSSMGYMRNELVTTICEVSNARELNSEYELEMFESSQARAVQSLADHDSHNDQIKLTPRKFSSLSRRPMLDSSTGSIPH